MEAERIALLYDIHGNLPALEAVLAETEAAGATAFFLGGDYAAFGPWPRETLERLNALPAVGRIRGNGERWLVEGADPPMDTEEFPRRALAAARDALGEGAVQQLYALPEQAELDGVLYCHGSPLSDVDSFAPEPEDDEERLLAGQSGRTVVFGHSHRQFRRPGPDGTDLLNPGSVGMPLDGDPRAAWALLDAGGFTFRRTEYDVERAAAAMRAHGEWAETVARRLEHGSD